MSKPETAFASRTVRVVRVMTLLCALHVAGATRADTSGVTLPLPAQFGDFPAGTFDDAGKRLGDSRLKLAPDGEGGVHMELRAMTERGARTRASAWLAESEDGQSLRILRQESQSHDDSGASLGVLSIDHTRGIASCKPPEGKGKERGITLSEGERVVNVPLNLLFIPLVRGDTERVDFQVFLCRGGPRVMDFRAEVARRMPGGDGRSIIEVSYGPELGGMVGWMAKRLIPKMLFWFESDRGGTYIAHRMPLYSKGPEVVVVRDGVSPESLRNGVAVSSVAR